MKHLKTFETYIINEYSKNDPIPEFTQSTEPLAVFLMGSPAAGKSTFITNFIEPRKRDIKTFSSDYLSLLFTKDPNVRKAGSGELNRKRIEIFLNTKQSFIYDTTGTFSEQIVDLTSKAKENGYKIIFISLITPLDTALKQNIERDRQTSEEFLKFSYDTIWSNIKSHVRLNPDSFYIITNLNNEYTFYKLEDGELKKRKGSFYA